jgi:HSP20 family molecular chaperone IbpA
MFNHVIRYNGQLNDIFRDYLFLPSTIRSDSNDDQDDSKLVYNVAGARPENISINVDGSILTINYKINDHVEQERLKLLENDDIDAITSTFEYGLLTIIIPKLKKKSFTKKIEIKVK